jgi:hypothetical protein
VSTCCSLWAVLEKQLENTPGSLWVVWEKQRASIGRN